MRKRSVNIISATNGRDKVGFAFDSGTQITVPAHYLDCGQKSLSDFGKSEKDKLKRLIKAWRKYQQSIVNEGNGISEGKIDNYNFDLALSIIQDFIENGLYIEFENIKTIRKSGKMEFADTIKKCKPILTNQGAVYLDYYTKVKKNDDQSILQAAQALVLNEIAEQIGWAIGFTVFVEVTDRTVKLNESLVTRLLRLRNNSFNTRKIHLINLIARYIEMKANLDKNSDDYMIATAYRFWEAIVANVVGNVGKRKLNKIFFTRHEYIRKSDNTIAVKNKPLMPDAAYADDANIVVLDAKYYMNGMLPMNYDITKQFAYMDKAQAYYSDQGDYQYRNIMVLPTDGATEYSDLIIVFDEDYPDEKIPIELLYLNFTDALNAYVAGNKLDAL